MTKEHYEAGDIVFCKWYAPGITLGGKNTDWRGVVTDVRGYALDVEWYYPTEGSSTVEAEMVCPGDDFEALVKRTARNACMDVDGQHS